MGQGQADGSGTERQTAAGDADVPPRQPFAGLGPDSIGQPAALRAQLWGLYFQMRGLVDAPDFLIAAEADLLEFLQEAPLVTEGPLLRLVT